MSRKALVWLNFFLADVRDGLGPYLAIYLLTSQHWTADKIGVVLTVTTVATLVAQTPAGAFIDSTKFKRLAIAITALVIGCACVLISWLPTFPIVVSLKVLIGVATAFIPPAIAGITLGLVGPDYFSRQVGTNEAYNHAGNIVAAVLAGIIGYYISNAAIFYLVAMMAVAAVITVMFINPKSIDNDIARGLIEAPKKHTSKPSGFAAVFESRTLLIFTLAMTLFHFANASMLPLISQKLAINHLQRQSSLFVSACIIGAQLVMIPMAILVGHKANVWGRRPIFLVAFLVLPIRGLLYTLGDNHYYLIAVQMLDGVGAGIFGALFLIVIADLTKGTGHYNLALGAANTIIGVGASLSTLIGGYIAAKVGYNVAFLFLAGIAVLGLLLYFFGVPETLHWYEKQHGKPANSIE